MDTGDVRQRYPVVGYSALRMLPGRGRRVLALVQWEGDRWRGCDTWEPIANLTPDLRAQAYAEALNRWPIGRPKVTVVSRKRSVAAFLRRGRLRLDGEVVGNVVRMDEDEVEEAGTVRVSRVVHDDEVRRRARKRRITIRDSDDDST